MISGGLSTRPTCRTTALWSSPTLDPTEPPTSPFAAALTSPTTRLAVWARDPQGGLPGALAHNPNVTLVYREPNPGGGRSRAIINIRGHGRLSADEAERRKVYETMPEVERVPDPEMTGVAVIIVIESITGFIPGYTLRMRR